MLRVLSVEPRTENRKKKNSEKNSSTNSQVYHAIKWNVHILMYINEPIFIYAKLFIYIYYFQSSFSLVVYFFRIFSGKNTVSVSSIDFIHGFRWNACFYCSQCLSPQSRCCEKRKNERKNERARESERKNEREKWAKQIAVKTFKRINKPSYVDRRWHWSCKRNFVCASSSFLVHSLYSASAHTIHNSVYENEIYVACRLSLPNVLRISFPSYTKTYTHTHIHFVFGGSCFNQLNVNQNDFLVPSIYMGNLHWFQARHFVTIWCIRCVLVPKNA